MQFNTLLLHESEGVLEIKLNRPDRRNAMTAEMQDELIAALAHAEESSAKVVMLAGSGASFCAGLDLAELASMSGKSAAEHVADARRIARLFSALYTLSLPTIAVVNGPAIAGGAGLAILCDFTLAIPEAKFGFTEVKIGFIPALVSVYLGLQIGEKRARSLLLTGRLFDAQEAKEIGLVNEIVPAQDLSSRAHLLAHQLMQNSPAALRATKQLLLAGSLPLIDAQLERAIQANSSSRENPDFSEGVSAFLQKRKPGWRS